MRGPNALLRLLCAASLGLSGPAAAAGGGIRNPGTLVHLATRSWFTLDPHAAYDAVSFIVTGNVYEPLIAFKSLKDPDELMPFLAEQVPSRKNGLLSMDRTVYTFPIRSGVRFHSGDRMTAEDVRYSILRFMLSDARGGAALLLKPILGVYGTRDEKGDIIVDFEEASRAVSVQGDSVVIRLKEPDNTFLKVLASLPIIVSKEWASEHGEWDGSEGEWMKFNKRPWEKSYFHAHMNGTGAFKLSSADREKGELILERHKKYWRKPAALERVMLRVVPSAGLRLSMLEYGDADSSYFEDRDYHDVRELSGVAIVDDLPMTTLGETLFFTFHTAPGSKDLGSGKLDGKGIPPDFFQDHHVREGFAYALDYEAYLKKGLSLRGERAAGPIPESLLPGYRKVYYSHDPKKAEAAFRKAFGGKLWDRGFSVTLSYSPSNANRCVLAGLIKSGVEGLNPKFQVRVHAMTSEELYAASGRHELPLYIAGFYADYPDPQSFAYGLLHSKGYFAKAQVYADEELDQLIEAARGASDRRARLGLYRRISRLADENIVQVYTYQPSKFRAARTWVKGLGADYNISNLGLNNFPYFYVLSKE